MDRYYTENGYFDLTEGGTFVITNTNMIVPWEYIYQNRDILLKVDQYGLCSATAHPPEDITLFKRDTNEKQSKWLTYFKCEEVNGGIPFTNFAYPNLSYENFKAEKTEIIFSPYKATYNYDYAKLSVSTEVFIPRSGVSAVMKITVKNKSDAPLELECTTALDPYIAEAILMPWNKSEWYLKTTSEYRGDILRFCSHMSSPDGIKQNHRYVTFNMDINGDNVGSVSNCLSKEKFIGNLDINLPLGVKTNKLESINEPFFSCPPIFAGKQTRKIGAGESICLTQILAMQSSELSDEQEKIDNRFFNKIECEKAEQENKKFFNELFNVRKVKSRDIMLDYFVNTFLPLEMYWVASLDRGWPTGMRGVRDASNDFITYSAIDGEWSSQILTQLFSCERSDGWLPRQISTSGKNGKHDLRNYVDGGIVALEFAFEYINQTGDIECLKRKLTWLDKEEKSTLLEHLIACGEFYINKENIGEHGLVKIYGGDWLDAVNSAGLKGRGESVTVTAQSVFVLKELAEIIKIAQENGIISKKESMKLRETFYKSSNAFKSALNESAYNKKGFYNGVFNDDGKWIFSNNDSDGVERVYSVANCFGIISGATNETMTKKVLENLEKLKCKHGYRLFNPPFIKPIANVGRIASGDMPSGHMENGNVYNHGSQGFFLRALSIAGKAKQFEEVMQYILPYNNDYHQTAVALTSPYAVVNCYQEIPEFNGRGGMSFLTGTVAVALRSVYEFYLGIKLSYYGICFSPMESEKIDNTVVKMNYRGCKLEIIYHMSYIDNVFLNGEEISERRIDTASGKSMMFIDKKSLKQENIIEIYYKNGDETL